MIPSVPVSVPSKFPNLSQYQPSARHFRRTSASTPEARHDEQIKCPQKEIEEFFSVARLGLHAKTNQEAWKIKCCSSSSHTSTGKGSIPPDFWRTRSLKALLCLSAYTVNKILLLKCLRMETGYQDPKSPISLKKPQYHCEGALSRLPLQQSIMGSFVLSKIQTDLHIFWAFGHRHLHNVGKRFVNGFWSELLWL